MADTKNKSSKSQPKIVLEEEELFEKVVHVNRCAKVVKGGRRFSFAALVVVGDQKGNVGYGYGKAQMVPDAIRKGTDQAKKAMRPVSLQGETIPHPVLANFDGGKVLLRPARKGTGIIAGGGEDWTRGQRARLPGIAAGGEPRLLFPRRELVDDRLKQHHIGALHFIPALLATPGQVLH